MESLYNVGQQAVAVSTRDYKHILELLDDFWSERFPRRASTWGCEPDMELHDQRENSPDRTESNRRRLVDQLEEVTG